MNYKAGEAAVALKDYEKGAELFMKSAEILLAKHLKIWFKCT